jgi:hypothetical protein
VLASTLLLLHSSAQSTDETALRDILSRMQGNMADYLRNVPNFFCDEHVLSSIEEKRATQKTSTDSIFRLRRSAAPAGELQFTESREIAKMNGRPAQGEKIQGPTIFTGAFTNAAAVVSLDLAHCYDYKLLPNAPVGKSFAIVVDFASQESALTDSSCPTPERVTGRAYIDPQNFHLLRVEAQIPNHDAVDGILALWTWEIDYAPVSFDSRQFWMPRRIASKAQANDKTAVWSFTANYSNYHKLNVTSHIVTDDGGNPQPQ